MNMTDKILDVSSLTAEDVESYLRKNQDFFLAGRNSWLNYRYRTGPDRLFPWWRNKSRCCASRTNRPGNGCMN